MEKQKYAIGIRLKVTVFVCAVALIFVAIAITAGYRYSFRSLGLTAGENYRHMAELLAGTVNDIINNDVDLIKTNANAGVLKDAVRVSNARYQSDEKSTQRYLMDMDKKWIEMPAGHPLVKEYMENKASLSLQSFLEEYGKKVISIMATDKFGGLVAASSKTSDFYFGDKDWWKEAFGAGRGKILIGDIVFDEKANAWTLPFTVPIKDESGDAIGAYRILMNITAFFGPLEDFRIGRTGNAAMVDDKAYLVFYPNAKPFTNKFCEYGELQHILQSDRKWGRLDSAYLHGKGALAAFADVTHQQDGAA